MPKYPKSRPNIPFDGTTCKRYDKGYVWNKVVFTLIGDDLRIQFYHTPHRHTTDFYIENFKNYTAREVIVNINDFNVTPKTVTSGEWGNHFEDGIYEIWHALDLPFGWIPPITRVWQA